MASVAALLLLLLRMLLSLILGMLLFLCSLVGGEVMGREALDDGMGRRGRGGVGGAG